MTVAAGGGATRLFGRERELEAILGSAAEVAEGRSATVLLEGSSGMGASRLIDEALALLASGMAGDPAGGVPTVLRGDALPAWRGAPYAPFRAAMERLLAGMAPDDALRLLGPAAELLLLLLPGAAARLSATEPVPATRERLADRILEAFGGVIGRLASDSPVVLVIEDLHVLDAASRSLLAFLARTIGERPVLLVGSYQPDALGRGHPLHVTLDAIASGPRPRLRLALPPLDRAALRGLVAEREGEAPSAPTLLLVAERSGGNPLIAEEVLAARRELSGAALSAPLEQLVVARAARRTPECRRVLRILSLAEGPLAPAELAAVATAYDAGIGRPAPRSGGHRRRGSDGMDGDLAAGVEEAIEHGFVVGRDPVAGSGSGTRTRRPGHATSDAPLSVRHELLAAALAADLLPGPRRRMHAATAIGLEARPAESARHWHLAREAVSELRAEMAAAAGAEAVGAAADALAHLERAIEIAGAPVAADVLAVGEELDLLSRAADAAAAAGDAGRAEAFIASAVARHADAGDRRAHAELTRRLGAYRLDGGDRDGAVAAFERALLILPTDPTCERARLLATLAHIRVIDGSYTDAERLADEAVAMAALLGPDARAWHGHATCTLGVVDSWLGRPDRAVRRLEEALAVATQLARLDDEFRAWANLTTALDLQGRRDEAVEVALRGIEAAEAVGLEVVYGNVLRANAVDFLVSLGRWREARALATRALAWAPSGIPFVIAALGLAIVEIETTAGDEAAEILGRLFLEIETVPYVELAVPVYQAAASFGLWRRDVTDAARAIDAGWARLQGTEEWALAARFAAAALAVADARVASALERHDLASVASARTWAGEILRVASRMVSTSGVPADSWVRREVEADLATARAYAARLRGSDDPATWADVAARWRDVRRPYETARALFCEAGAHLAAAADLATRREGRDEARDDARKPLVASAAIALELEARPLLRAIGDLADRARISLPPDVTAGIAASAVEASAARRPAVGRGERRRAAMLPGPEPRTAASFGLSARERGVLAEIVAGRTNREIGQRLFISEKTVSVHVGNILSKLGVGGRVEAATIALRLGLVEDVEADANEPGPRGPGSGRRRRGGTA